MLKKIILQKPSTALFLALTLSACGKNLHVNVPNPGNLNSNETPTGNTGLKQTSGNSDQNGIEGKDGSKVLMGKSDPETKIGTDGDAYLNTESGDLFQKQPTLGWVKQGNIKGPKGEAGSPTTNTLASTPGNRFFTEARPPLATDASAGDLFLDSSSPQEDLYKKLSDGTWVLVTHLKGDKGNKGDAGKTFQLVVKAGTSELPSTPVDGHFLDSTTGKLYTKHSDETIEFLTNLKGAVGDKGADGTMIFDGTDAPVKNLGRIGDYFINLANGDVYKKDTETNWKMLRNLFNGPKSATAEAGNKFKVASGAPMSSALRSGDVHIDPTTGNLFVKISDHSLQLALVFKLEGFPAGNKSSFLEGVLPPVDSAGLNGDLYLDSAKLELYKKTDDGRWKLLAHFKGPKGDQGDAGKNAILTAKPGMNDFAAAPNDGLYLDTQTGNLYSKHSDGTPELLMNIVGVAGKNGAEGANGTHGSTFLLGTEAPTAILGRVGDYYLNQTNGDFYKKQTETTWIWVMNFSAPKTAVKIDPDLSADTDGHQTGDDEHLLLPIKASKPNPLPVQENKTIPPMIERAPDLVLSLESGVAFGALGTAQFGYETGISSPNKISAAKLLEVASLLKKNSSSIQKIQIVGNCDKVGTEADNKRLSLRRAKGVQKRLIQDGVNAELFTVCRGDGEPAQSSCGTSEACPHDRRVDIDVTLNSKLTGPAKNEMVKTLNTSFDRIWKSL